MPKQPDDKQAREIRQLWFVACYYLEEAGKIKRSLCEDALKKTVADYAEYFKDDVPSDEIIRSVVCFSAHLDSCATRLFAIADIFDVLEISALINGRTLKNTTNIFCMLRQTTCHDEPNKDKRKEKKFHEDWIRLSKQELIEIWNGLESEHRAFHEIIITYPPLANLRLTWR